MKIINIKLLLEFSFTLTLQTIYFVLILYQWQAHNFIISKIERKSKK